ncbi:PAS domain-containing protein [Candidatus Latescibacterota bacterium]
MIENKELVYILNSIPYPIVYVDINHIVRFLNSTAQHIYYTQRGYDNLIGKSIFDCHKEPTKNAIIKIVESLKNHGNEKFLKVNVRNERVYVTPVRNDDGELVGYYERFENNFEA